MKLRSTEESDFKDLFLAECAKMRNARIWRQNVGTLANYRGKAGATGMSDMSGISEHGQRIEIELKARGKKPSKAQLSWLRFIDRMGGLAFCFAPLKSEEELKVSAQMASDAVKMRIEFGWRGVHIKDPHEYGQEWRAQK